MKRPREKEFFSNDGRMTFFTERDWCGPFSRSLSSKALTLNTTLRRTGLLSSFPPLSSSFFLSGPSNDCRQEVKVLKGNADDDILMWVLHCTSGTVCWLSLCRLDSMKMCPSSCWVSHKTIEVQSTRGQNHKDLREEGRRLMFPMSVFKWFYGNSKPLKFPSMASRVARNY